jgi:hypothetical protein
MDGIWYWRCKLTEDLPDTDHVPRKLEPFEEKFPTLENPVLISGICDVSIAPGMLTCKSFGSKLVLLANLALTMYLVKSHQLEHHLWVK